MDNKQIGARLKESRKAAGLTQEAVATELGVNRQAVSNWETGRETPRAEAWFILGQLYGVSLDYIVYGIRTIPISGGSTLMARIFRPQGSQPSGAASGTPVRQSAS